LSPAFWKKLKLLNSNKELVKQQDKLPDIKNLLHSSVGKLQNKRLLPRQNNELANLLSVSALGSAVSLMRSGYLVDENG
jgi:UTP:GlnB (protein PII) uridylyltransferase